MSDLISVDQSKHTNLPILKYLSESAISSLSRSSHLFSCSPKEVDDPYYNLGTHPELVERLWDGITTDLPTNCRWIVYGIPTLVRPDTGVIFGFAGGTHTYALRLPAKEGKELEAATLAQAIENANKFDLKGEDRENYLRNQTGHEHFYSDGSSLDLLTISGDWCLCRFLKDETRWCRVAYEYAV